jgi:hypothetical protein
MQPLVEAIYDLQAPLLLHGSHPWAHTEYHQWCTGGNGGFLPLKPAEYLPTLDAGGRALIRNTYKKAGIAPVDRPDEEFVVGKMNYDKGIRPAGLACVGSSTSVSLALRRVVHFWLAIAAPRLGSQIGLNWTR